MTEGAQSAWDKELDSSPNAANMSDNTLQIPNVQTLHESNPKINLEHEDNRLACLQVFGAFFCMFNSWGIANSYGVFQSYYEVSILQGQSASNISWIGSIQAFLLLFAGGFVTGPIYDAGHVRALVVFGTIAIVFGMIMTSICTQYWQFVLAQGITIGLGLGCLLLSGVAGMPAYFRTRTALATGIATSGSSIGGIIYPIVFHSLVHRIGFGWTTRVMAFIVLATLSVPITIMRAKSLPATRRPLFDTRVLREIPYILFTFGEFFAFMGMYAPYYYVSSYSFENNIADANLSFYALIILNAGSFFGRIVPNFFSDKIGPLNVTMPFCILCGIIGFCWTTIHSIGQLTLFSLFYGFFSGTFVSITGPALATLSPDLSLIGTHMGMSFAFAALGLLVGNPVVGVLLNKAGWIGPAAFCGTANIVAGSCIAAARWWKVGWSIRVKI